VGWTSVIAFAKSNDFDQAEAWYVGEQAKIEAMAKNTVEEITVKYEQDLRKLKERLKQLGDWVGCYLCRVLLVLTVILFSPSSAAMAIGRARGRRGH